MVVADIRDVQEHSDVAAILAALPEWHQARIAYSDGADTIQLSHLVPRELAGGLAEAYLSGYRRYLQRQGGYFRS